MALMSGKVYSNTGAPSNADGVNGDIYMQLDGFKTTYRKEGGSWVAIGSTLGAIPEFVSGVGTPSNSLGEDGQYYRDTANQDIYYKQGSMWNLVGNLLGAAFTPVLEQGGIGKYLGTAPNLISAGSLNTVKSAGEYAYTSDVSDTPTGGAGIVKVWGEDATHVYQIVQDRAVNGKIFHRLTNDGGTTWSYWTSYAFTNGSSANDFKVLGGTTPNSAVAYSQLSSLLNGFSTDSDSFKLPESLGGWKIKWGHTLLGDDIPVTAHTTTITGFTEIKTVLVGSTTTDNFGAFIYHRQSFNNNSVTVVFDEWTSQIQNGAGYWWFAIGK